MAIFRSHRDRASRRHRLLQSLGQVALVISCSDKPCKRACARDKLPSCHKQTPSFESNRHDTPHA
jgi:hypothetical protein